MHVSLHLPEDQRAFNALDFVHSDWENEDGDPKYGQVEGADHGYLARTLYRGCGVLAQAFMNTSIRRKVAAGA